MSYGSPTYLKHITCYHGHMFRQFCTAVWIWAANTRSLTPSPMMEWQTRGHNAITPEDCWEETGHLGFSCICQHLHQVILHPVLQWKNGKQHILTRSQACKLTFRLNELISCFCCVQTSHVAIKADSQTAEEAAEHEQGVSSLSQPKFEFTGLHITDESDWNTGETRYCDYLGTGPNSHITIYDFCHMVI